MDRPIPSSQRWNSKWLPVLPFLLLFALILGKKDNRTVLKSQISYMMSDKVRDLEKIYEDMEDRLLMTLFSSGSGRLFTNHYEQKVRQYPQYDSEITMLAANLARTYGGEFVTWQTDNVKHSSIYGLGQNVPNIDELPYFGECENLEKIGKAICSESSINEYIYQELKMPYGAESGGVTIEVVVQESGYLSDFEVIASSNVDEALKKEALRVAKKMPKWQAAKRSGKAVACKIYLPFIFEKDGMIERYAKPINTDSWKIVDKEESSIKPLFKLEKARIEVETILSSYKLATSNKMRRFRALQLSKIVRKWLMDYPKYYEELSDMMLEQMKENDISFDLETDKDGKLTDIVMDIVELPEPNYNDEDKIYADLYEIMQQYETGISEPAELILEEQLANLFWDFINRFPGHVEVAQSALQHACNSKKISTHTVTIQKEKAQVTIDLVGRKK